MSTPMWRKSSHSGGASGSDCVEVADLSGAIGIRDSKNPAGPRLFLSDRSFAMLVSQVKAHQLDR
ncbi:MAG TPA: DUF397 domain-containing protein [Streptosporangiaceae bacterium]